MGKLLESLGTQGYRTAYLSGVIFFTFWNAMLWLFRPPFRYREFIRQFEFIGFGSLFVVILTGTFTGMVLALQLYIGFSKFHAEYLVGAVAAISITRELGPVLSALMITARAGSAMAAELGTMKVTEQVDALESMAVEPIQYLVTPRIVAAFLMFPLLTIVADFMGILGSYVVGVHLLGINPVVYMDKMVALVEISDITSGLVKAAVFGVIVSSVSCGIGLQTSQGAVGVGRSTTSAVVLSSTLILVADYLLTALMF
ncbi:MlaE family ABC transporter permease [Chrysiogenes arsenatis]|uniref:MlaE family ABC transporter permease n=1 Tax=Chrysiogenes arsenatis TaxID=309797 RepID=UPI0004183527|nr:ABC transporter permease [Chrysiogenes arsenatis]